MESHRKIFSFFGVVPSRNPIIFKVILHEKILLEGYYWKNITLSCKIFIKNCEICMMKNKSTFIPPPSNQIICSHPRELYLIDITELPNQIINNNESKIYLLSLIDHFSKFEGNYVLTNKEAGTVLNKIKNFISLYGKQDKILTDNGSEFINKKFKKYCKSKEITIISLIFPPDKPRKVFFHGDFINSCVF